MNRLTEKCWRNLDPWECCGQDKYCQRGCHDKGGCTNGCIVPKLYSRLAKYEDLEERCHEQNYFSLSHLLDKWECFLDDVQELLEYRRLEEQGLLLRLPCKVGDKVYRITSANTKIVEDKVLWFEKYSSNSPMVMLKEYGDVSAMRFGKTVFLTKEKAEQKLAEMKGE